MSINITNNSSSITTTTVELKTPTPGKTKTEQIKTGFQNVNEYMGYLQGKYSYMNAGRTSMHGIPTSVTVSGAFLKQCMDNPEKAKFLEENLAAIPDGVQSLINHTKMMPGSPVVTYTSYQIDANGNISCMSGCTNDPDGRIARENAERRAKEKQAEKERAEERKAAEKKKEERRAEKKLTADRQKNEYSFTITGNSIKNMIQSVSALRFSSSSDMSKSIAQNFDMKV